jgi:hypothetical protein
VEVTWFGSANLDRLPSDGFDFYLAVNDGLDLFDTAFCGKCEAGESVPSCPEIYIPWPGGRPTRISTSNGPCALREPISTSLPWGRGQSASGTLGSPPFAGYISFATRKRESGPARGMGPVHTALSNRFPPNDSGILAGFHSDLSSLDWFLL